MSLRHTPLYETHRGLGARLVEFAGFEMPVQYASIVEEHRAVRDAVGLFDVSHMGQLHLLGPGAVATTERLVSCPVASLRTGRVRYGCLCNESGGVVDDVTVHRVADEELFLCVNAANREKDRAWVEAHLLPETRLEDRSDATALLALQGPASQSTLARVSDVDLAGLRRFRFLDGKVAGIPARIARTGYTGSDGFELYAPAERAAALWDAISAAGRPDGLTPAGLGARDTLRLEAALPLYGHELDDETSPLEARLDRFVKLDVGGFVGAEAIARRRDAGHAKLLVGLVLEERGVARAGYAIAVGGETVGAVTSGAPSPTLGKSIGLGYVPERLATVGTKLDILIRGRPVPGRVVETPFI